MKKLLTALFFYSATFFSVGQSYHALVDTNKVWSVVERNEDCGPPFLVHWDTYFMRFEGDTAIGVFQYKELLYTNDSLQTGWQVFGFVREDINKRVYALLNDTAEVLLYDFSLNAGDSTTIYEYYGWGWDTCSWDIKIDSIDSVTLLNGEMRKQWHVSSGVWSFDWMEGIGSNLGLVVHQRCLVGAIITRELMCFTENDTLKYQHTNYSNCYYSTVGITAGISDKVHAGIFPNPTAGKFTVQGASGEIQVYDLFGRLVLSSRDAQIDMRGFASGMYFVKVGEVVKKLVIGN